MYALQYIAIGHSVGGAVRFDTNPAGGWRLTGGLEKGWLGLEGGRGVGGLEGWRGEGWRVRGLEREGWSCGIAMRCHAVSISAMLFSAAGVRLTIPIRCRYMYGCNGQAQRQPQKTAKSRSGLREAPQLAPRLSLGIKTWKAEHTLNRTPLKAALFAPRPGMRRDLPELASVWRFLRCTGKGF